MLHAYPGHVLQHVQDRVRGGRPARDDDDEYVEHGARSRHPARALCSTYIDDHIIIADYILDTLKDIARACNILLAAESARTPAAAGR